jgi:hypothetical protein
MGVPLDFESEKNTGFFSEFQKNLLAGACFGFFSDSGAGARRYRIDGKIWGAQTFIAPRHYIDNDEWQ